MPKSKKDVKASDELAFVESCGNVFKDLGFEGDEAASMLARGQLAVEIRRIIEQNGWTQRQAATEMGIAQPRVAEIMKMRIEHFSIDTLIKYLGKLHHKVSITVEPINDVA